MEPGGGGVTQTRVKGKQQESCTHATVKKTLVSATEVQDTHIDLQAKQHKVKLPEEPEILGNSESHTDSSEPFGFLLDLFAGIMALEEAAADLPANFETAYSELSEMGNAVAAKHWSKATNMDDITLITEANVETAPCGIQKYNIYLFKQLYTSMDIYIHARAL